MGGKRGRPRKGKVVSLMKVDTDSMTVKAVDSTLVVLRFLRRRRRE